MLCGCLLDLIELSAPKENRHDEYVWIVRLPEKLILKDRSYPCLAMTTHDYSSLKTLKDRIGCSSRRGGGGELGNLKI